MTELVLHEFHAGKGATFGAVPGGEVVRHYGELAEERRALQDTVALLDLSFRTRLVVLGADRDRFLNGQVTNDLKRLSVGEGCYAAIVNARGKMDADANIYRLTEEWLLDAEPGLTEKLSQRLEHHIVADDVQVADAAPHYGLLTTQGARADAVMGKLFPDVRLPAKPFACLALSHPDWGQVYVMNQPRSATAGYDLFAPIGALALVAGGLDSAVAGVGGRWAGWDALEMARIEAGIPRYGADMDDATLPPEAGIEARAISYSKGCYIGQEIIARIRTYGQVARALRGLRLARAPGQLPAQGDPLLKDGKIVGSITSAVWSLRLEAAIALGYVRRECQAIGTSLQVRCGDREITADIVPLPFVNP